MNENASSNITQIFAAFETFINAYDYSLWTENVSPENIKSAFKLGLFLEKCIEKFKNKEYLSEFMKVLEVWCQKNCIKFCDEHFLLVANDKLLEKVFKQVDVKETTLDISVRVYCSIYPKERFKSLLKNLILTSSSICAIANFINERIDDDTYIKNSIVLNKWNEFILIGKETVLKSEIENFISLYKVEQKLPVLLSLLSTDSSINNYSQVKSIILDGIVLKMNDRSLLSKNFWLTLFKTVKKDDIGKVSDMYTSFLESLFNFIEYAVSMFQRDMINKLEWKSDPSLSLYPEINYLDILYMLKAVINANNSKKHYIFERLDQAEEHSKSELWIQLKNDLLLNDIEYC